MPSKPDDGGPVIPAGAGFEPGSMSLRDYFAGQALAGHLGYAGQPIVPAMTAIDLYAMADAMLAARQPKEN